MKGQFRIVQNLVRRACKEGVRGIDERHVKIVDSMSSQDIAVIQKTGDLPDDRRQEIGETPKAVEEAILFVRACIHGPSYEALKNAGISIVEIDDGMAVVEFRELDD